MNFIKRAFTSSFRNIGKTIIFFFLVVLLTSVIGATIFVNQAVTNTEQNLLNNLPPVATIQIDMDEFAAISNRTGEVPALTLTPEQIRRVAELPYVREYDFFSSRMLHSLTLVPYDRGGDIVVHREEFGYRWVLQGVQNPNIHDIQEGHIELVDGRTFTRVEVDNLSTVAMISENVAAENNLSVGCFISLRNVVQAWDNTGETGNQGIFADESYDVEIVGIFRPLLTADTVDILDNLENRIYVPNNFIEMSNRFMFQMMAEMEDTIEFDENRIINYVNIFTLNSAHDLPAFREAALHGIPRQFVVYDAGNPFQDVASAMESILEMSAIILYLTVGASIVTWSLLITIFLHDRKREIGIYLSVGVKKKHILLQFALEIIVVAIIGIGAALFVGQYASEVLSHRMLVNDVVTQQTGGMLGIVTMDALMQTNFQADLSLEGLIQGHSINLSFELMLTFFMVGIGSTLLSTIAPIIYVLKLNPKEIMM